jgi:hypothetical protein
VIILCAPCCEGAKKQLTSTYKQWSDKQVAAWISAVIAASTFALTAIAIIPLLKRHCDKHFDR